MFYGDLTINLEKHRDDVDCTIEEVRSKLLLQVWELFPWIQPIGLRQRDLSRVEFKVITHVCLEVGSGSLEY